MAISRVVLAISLAMLACNKEQKAKDDFRDNVCGALVRSGGKEGAPSREDLAAALNWANANTLTKDAHKVSELAAMEGVAKPFIAELLRVGGKEKVGYVGPCPLADAFEKMYPCPEGEPTRCGKGSK